VATQQLTIDVTDDLKDILTGELAELGAAGIWESGEPSPGMTRLEIYFSSVMPLEDVRLRVESLFARSRHAIPEIHLCEVQERDWLEEWKRSYVSFPIGRRFFIIPSWSDSKCPSDRMPIHIDPGQAFGTGTHETTQLTLGLLEECVGVWSPAAQVLDLGTGSGILAIAASLLGFQRVVGCDNDPDSVRVAQENIARNANGAVTVYCGSMDSVPTSSVDLLLCNLTAEAIADLFGEIQRAVRPGGDALLSGILIEQRDRIHGVVTRGGFTILQERTQGEWLGLAIRKSLDSDGD
jgi:ribosomal protein L11 methyltransferase